MIRAAAFRRSPRAGGQGGAAVWLLAAALAAFVAAMGLGAAEHARSLAQAAAAQRALAAGLLAAEAALAQGATPAEAEAAFQGAVAANWPGPAAAAELSIESHHLSARLTWTYRPAFLPLPPLPARATRTWPRGAS